MFIKVLSMLPLGALVLLMGGCETDTTPSNKLTTASSAQNTIKGLSTSFS